MFMQIKARLVKNINKKEKCSIIITKPHWSKIIKEFPLTEQWQYITFDFDFQYKVFAPNAEIVIVKNKFCLNLHQMCANTISFSKNQVFDQKLSNICATRFCGTKTVDFSNVVFENVKTLYYIFSYINNVKLPENAFVNCINLRKMISIFKKYKNKFVPKNFYIPKSVAIVEDMFANSLITELPFGFKIPKNVQNMKGMFYHSRIKRLPFFGTFSKKRYPSLLQYTFIFAECKHIKKINIKFKKSDYDFDELRSSFQGLYSIYTNL